MEATRSLETSFDWSYRELANYLHFNVTSLEVDSNLVDLKTWQSPTIKSVI